MKNSKKISTIIVCALVMVLAACSGSGRTEEEGASPEVKRDGVMELEITESAGTYLETKLELPLSKENDFLEDLCKREDGTWAAWLRGGKLCVSKDEGKTWELQESAWYQAFIEKNEILSSMTALAPDGTILSGTLSYEFGGDLENVNWSDKGEQYFTYILKTAEGNVEEGKFIMPEGERLMEIWYSEENRLFGQGYSRAYAIDLKGGRTELLIEGEGIAKVSMAGSIMIAPGSDRAYLYDLDQKELMPQDKVLDTFVSQKKADGQEILFEKGEGNSVYMLCRDGLYRHILRGTSIELVIDGRDTSIRGMDMVSGRGFGVTGTAGSRNFFIPADNGSIAYFSYSDSVDDEPKKTIRVFNLIEDMSTDNSMKNNAMEIAIKRYESLHPEIQIEYEVGISSGTAVTREDVIKNLNMELAAGKGPDILVLEGLPAEDYISKGILTDLSEIVEGVDAKEGLFPQIVDCYTETDGSIYQIPLGFTTNIICGPKIIVDQAGNLTDFADSLEEFVEKGSDWKSRGWVLFIDPFPPTFIEQFASSCMGAWITEEGKIDQEKLLEFFVQTDRIYQLNCTEMWDKPEYEAALLLDPQLTMRAWNKEETGGYEAVEEYMTRRQTRNMRNIQVSVFHPEGGNSVVSLGIGELGSINQFRNFVGANSKMKGNYMGFAQFNGQQENVFTAKNAVGINASSSNQEDAGKFVEFLLSAESTFGISNYEYDYESSILEVSFQFSINKTSLNRSFEKALLPEYEHGPSDEELKKLKAIVEAVKQPSPDNSELLSAVINAGAKVYWGDSTPEKAVKEVVDKMELYLAE